jgi:flavin-dependent dehydrogenase
MTEFAAEYDVAILGGGLAGLTLARELGMRRPGTRILVVEKSRHPCPESAHKVGESSVELAGRWFRDTLQLKDHLDAEHLPKLGLRYFLPGDKHDITSRLEYGPLLNKVPVPFRGLLVPSYQLDRGRLENFLAGDLPDTSHFRDGTEVTGLEIDGADRHRVALTRDGETHSVRARWLVDASGRKALLKTHLGLGQEAVHHANSVWWRVEGRIKVDEWSDDPEWASRIKAPIRWQSTCQLLGNGYWIWIISLAPDRTSVGIVADPRIHDFKEMSRPARAMEWIREHEPLLAADMEGREVCDFMALRDFSRNSTQVFSGRDRWGMTGDAGVFTDPFYSPGSDFIAIANSYNLDLITRELAGEDVGARAEKANYYFKLVYDQFIRVYRDHYPTMGNPQVMAAKIAFDNAFYWGWAVLAFQNGRLTDVDFLEGFHEQVMRSVSLQGRVEEFLREWHASEQPDVALGQYIDQFDLKMLWAIYTTLIRPIDGDVLERRLTENLDRLEAFAEVLFRRATRGNPRVEAAPHIDCHKLTLDESRWDAEGLFGGRDQREAVARIAEQMVPLWVDGTVEDDVREAAISRPGGPDAALVPQAAPAPLDDGGVFPDA